MEKVLWLIVHVKSGLRTLMLDISLWTVLHGQVDQLKLIAVKSRHWEQSMLYTMWEISNILNIQINKVIGENENYSYFYFMSFLLCEKNKWTFQPTQYFSSQYDGISSKFLFSMFSYFVGSNKELQDSTTELSLLLLLF